MRGLALTQEFLGAMALIKSMKAVYASFRVMMNYESCGCYNPPKGRLFDPDWE